MGGWVTEGRWRPGEKGASFLVCFNFRLVVGVGFESRFLTIIRDALLIDAEIGISGGAERLEPI